MVDRDRDMDWLYRREQPEPEPTAVMPASADDPWQAPAPRTGAAPVQPAPPPRPPAPPRPTRRRRRRRGSLPRLVGTLLALWLLFLVVTPLYAWVVGTRVDAAPAGDRPAAQPGTTVLLVGSDARDGLTPEEQSLLGTGSTEGRRTDTMMLLHTPTSGQPVLLSLPRDSLVSIPGRNDNRLNAAYAFGGAPLLVETVERNTGIRIDGYLEVGFLGVVGVVDAVGGIEVCPTFDIDDRDSHLTMSAGCQQVDGVTALGYVRMRKGDPRGDLGRVERQREVIGAIAGEVITPMTVLNPVRYWQLNMAASQSLTRGEDTGLLDILAVARGFLAATAGGGHSMTVPVAGTGNVDGVGSVVRWDDDAAAELFAALAAGDTTTLT